MVDLRNSISNLTFGTPRRLIGIIGWRVLDSLVSGIPSGVMIVAAWLLIQPLINPGATLDTHALWVCIGVLAVQAVLSYFVSRKIYILSCTGMTDAALDARLRLGEKLRRLPMGFYQEHGAGEILNVLQRDFETVMNYGSEVLSQILTTIVRIAIAVAVLFVFDWHLTVVLLAAVLCAIPFLVKGFSTMRQGSERLSHASQEAATRAIEYAGGITTLRAFGIAGSRSKALRDSFEELRVASLGKEEASRPVGLFGRSVLTAGTGFIMLAGAALAARNAIEPFSLLVFLLVALTIYEPIVMLFFYASEFAGAEAAGGRILALMNEDELPAPCRRVAAPTNAGVRFESVGFSYSTSADDSAPTLSDVSIDLPERSLVALVGPSGSGKSTICHLAARFWDPQEGRVALGNVNERDIAPDDVLAKVAIVFQDVFLFQGTVAENIRIGRATATDEEIRDAARRASALEFIEALPHGFDTPIGEGGSSLSGGERQRISIARALLKDAPIVLLDEVTSSLDPGNEVAVQAAIAELVRNRTVLVIAHRLSSIREADRIVVIEGGRVAAQGKHADLLENCDLYRAMWEAKEQSEGWRIA